MKKGKRGGIIVLVLLAVILLPSLAGWLIPSREPTDEAEATKYTITYQGVSYYKGELIDIYEGMYAKDGAYPTEAVAFTRVQISDLHGRMNKQPFEWNGFEAYTTTGRPVCDAKGYEYTFWGWYLDQECTQEFRGSMLIREDVTLYARIDVALWIGPY